MKARCREGVVIPEGNTAQKGLVECQPRGRIVQKGGEETINEWTFLDKVGRRRVGGRTRNPLVYLARVP